MKFSFNIRAYTPEDLPFIKSSIKKTFAEFKPDYDFSSGDNSILVACDTVDPSVAYSFIIVNQQNQLVFGYTKAIFRQFGLFRGLLEYFPDRPTHYINQPNYHSFRALKALKLTFLVRIYL